MLFSPFSVFAYIHMLCRIILVCILGYKNDFVTLAPTHNTQTKNYFYKNFQT